MPSVANAGDAPSRQSKSGARTIRIEFAREGRDFVIYSKVESAASRPDAFRAQPNGSLQSKSVSTSCPAKGDNFFSKFMPLTAPSSRAKSRDPVGEALR